MQIAPTSLKPLSGMTLTKEEQAIIKWLRSVQWEADKTAREPIPYHAKVPQFYGGVRLFNTQAGQSKGGLGGLELFIKKLQYQGVIGKQEMYPLKSHGPAPILALKKADLDNLGVGKDLDDDDE